MRSLFLASLFSILMLLGLAAPFIAALGYVWVDIVKPQNLAYSIINGAPLALISVIITTIFFLINDRKNPPKVGSIMLLLVFFSAWITLTTALSSPELQLVGWFKWKSSFYILLFTLFIPFIFRSRIQIESLLLIIIFSASTVFFSAGVKTALGSGGYGQLAIMGQENTGLSESSTLAAVCVMLIPLMHYCIKHTLIFPRNKLTKLFFIGLIGLALLTVVGTSARTGLIAIIVLTTSYFLRSQRKLLILLLLPIIFVISTNIDVTSTLWGGRMSTINTYEADSSALGRIAVWKWTLDFVQENPLGGGFNAYLLNGISSVNEQGIFYYAPGVLKGKAFHSVYFEILGEQGYLGFFVYFLIIYITLIKLYKIKKNYQTFPEFKWICDLSVHLRDSIIIFLAAGAFIGIGYQPYIFYLIAITISLEQYLVNSERLSKDEKIKGVSN